jgi:tetratricopeptide (TPR) repeat protein
VSCTRPRTRIGLLSALILWASIGAALAAPEKKAAPDLRRPAWGRVIGFLRDAATRQPLTGVTVSIQEGGEFAREGKTVGKSDAAGRFHAEAPLGKRSSKVDLQRLLTSAWFSIVLQPRSITRQTRIIDVTQLNVRAEKPGYKPFFGAVRCARLEPGSYRVYLDDIFLAPEGSSLASMAPDNVRHEIVESFTVSPTIAQPGEKVVVTLRARLPVERGGKYRAFLDTTSLALVRPGTELVAEKKPDPGTNILTFTRTLTLPKAPKDPATELTFFLLRDHDEVELDGDWRALLQVASTESDRQAAALVDEGFRLVMAGDSGPAVEKFRAACLLSPKYPPAHLYLGDTCLSLNRADDAAAAYQQLVDLFPDDWEVARPRYARALIEGGQAEQAARSLSAAEQQVKRVPYQVYLYRALSSASLGNFNAADADLTKAGQRRRIPARVRDAINLKRAQAAVAKSPESPDAHLGLARALADQKRWEESVRSIREALALDPNQAWGQMELGVALRQLGREEEAIAALEEALKLDPNNVDAHLELAETHRARQEYAKALPHYEFVAERRATNFTARHSLALVYFQTNRHDDAMREFAEALRLARGKGDLEQGLQIPLGYTALYFGPKKRLIAGFANEMAALDYVLLDSLETLKKKPEDGLAWLNIGSSLVRLRMPDLGLDALAKAGALEPSLIETKYWAALALRQLDRPEEARAKLQEVVQANPLHPHAHLELAQILTEAGETEEAQAHVLTHARNWPHERQVVQR